MARVCSPGYAARLRFRWGRLAALLATRSMVASRVVVPLVEGTVPMVRSSRWGSFSTTIFLERDCVSSSCCQYIVLFTVRVPFVYTESRFLWIGHGDQVRITCAVSCSRARKSGVSPGQKALLDFLGSEIT